MHLVIVSTFYSSLATLIVAASAFYVSASVQHPQIRDMTLSLGSREVYDPPITSPNSSTVWHVGSYVEVTWDTSSLPSDASGSNGQIVLGYLDGNSGNEHLDLKQPLARGVDLAEGHVRVHVPNVTAAGNYIVVLFGDSGNRSPTFTIQ